MKRLLLAANGVLAVVVLIVAPVAATPGASTGDGEVFVPRATDRADGPKRCPETVAPMRTPTVEGGCYGMTSTVPLELDVLSMLGPTPFTTCDAFLTLQTSRDGRVWIRDFLLDGKGLLSACGDVVQCRPLHGSTQIAQRRRLPWPGRMEQGSAGARIALLDACFDTCMGRFEGELEVRLEQHRGRLRLSIDDAPVGDSGLLLDTKREWSLRPLEGSPVPTLRR